MALQIDDSDFDEKVLRANGVVLIDFWAPWCGPCRAMSPIIDELGKDYSGKNVSVYKMNVDENTVVPQKYAIRAIPTLIIFKDGEVKDQMVGGVEKEQIVDTINKYL